MELIIHRSIRHKLASKNPPVSKTEIIQCFANRTGVFLEDTRENNRTDPPTKWFIAETDLGRKLKVCFMQLEGDVIIKTAYQPNRNEVRIYTKYSKAD